MLIFVKNPFFGFEKFIDFLNETKDVSSPIPKKIHYVWVGGPVPENIQKNIQEWQEKMPDYEIKKWDETNCNIKDNAFVRDAYRIKEWRFVSDWCRLEALDKEGGIYLDTDMKLNKSLEPLLTEDLILTFEHHNIFSAGIFAVKKHHPLIQKMKKYYRQQFNWSYSPNPTILTRMFWELEPFLKSYRIYPTNILMLDFKGGENIAEHMYNNGSAEYQACSEYAGHFQWVYVSQNAIHLKAGPLKEDAVEKLLILKEDNTYYEIKRKPDACYESTKGTGTFLKTDQSGAYSRLLITNEKNETKEFECTYNMCHPKGK